MQKGWKTKSQVASKDSISTSLGSALREEIVNKVSSLLHESESISSNNTRLMVQACCLDVVTSLEDLIVKYNLDAVHARTTC